jgi:hypothetical protein
MNAITIPRDYIDKLLKLDKAGQFALSLALSQCNGQQRFSLDRSSLEQAAKQKLKYGLKELIDKGLMQKCNGTRSDFILSHDIFQFTSLILAPSSQPNADLERPTSEPPSEEFEFGMTQWNFGLNNMIGKLNKQKTAQQNKEQWLKDQQEWEERYWSEQQRKQDNGTRTLTQMVEKFYVDIPGKNTKLLQQVCTEFIEEITNLTYFYDVNARIMHENELYKKFSGSRAFYENRRSNNKHSNILVELKDIIVTAKHDSKCIALLKDGKSCTCLEDSNERFNTLFRNGIVASKLSPSSKSEAKELYNHLIEWFSDNHPELMV